MAVISNADLARAIHGELVRIAAPHDRMGVKPVLNEWERRAVVAYATAASALAGMAEDGDTTEVMAALDAAIPEWWEDLGPEMGIA